MNKELKMLLSSMINERLSIAFHRLDEDPRHEERRRQQEKSEAQIEEMLEARLGHEEKMLFRGHMEGRMAKECFELDQAYMQGLGDGMRVLIYLDVFSI